MWLWSRRLCKWIAWQGSRAAWLALPAAPLAVIAGACLPVHGPMPAIPPVAVVQPPPWPAAWSGPWYGPAPALPVAYPAFIGAPGYVETLPAWAGGSGSGFAPPYGGSGGGSAPPSAVSPPGHPLPAVFRTEGDATTFIRNRVAPGTELMADESQAWNDLYARYSMQRINHQEAYSLDGACTNGAEGFFSRMRRAEIGHHHHIAGIYLARYAQEASWREDHRRVDNGRQVQAVMGLAMAASPSVDFCGYWQRAEKAA